MFRPTPKILVAIAAGVFLLCALAADTPAFQGEPSGRERMAMTPFEAVLSADQRQALLSMVKADKAKLRALHQRLHKAREALIDKLLAPGAAVDVSKETAELKAAQAAMIDERVSIALAARKLLSAQQLKDAAAFHAKLEDLHRQEAALMEQMEDARGGRPQTGQ